ncbi:5-formyltetrahydrofolate cyclo-ligase [Chlamydia sp. 17-3921]|uniref:5-formyltetrahydrofolate cyclo-ligase n=1 Tax=Chlamydia sp. 17-3921 TaxID=2675798 RepID=UPI00191A4CF1|nr:5-formyltetrahydrofolate cyclo-ligase [Chlamydia sp. 17-3921]
MTTFQTKKQLLRKTFSDLRQRLPKERKIQASKIVASFVQEFPPGSLVMSFLSFNSEINMVLANHVLLEKFTLALPRIQGNLLFPNLVSSSQELSLLSHPKDISNHKLNLIPSNLLTHVLVPGLVFDRKKNRLGYGKGFYDRWLSQQPNITSIGIGYLEQQVEELIKESHDVPLSQLFLC